MQPRVQLRVGGLLYLILTVVQSDIAIQFQHIFLDCKNMKDLYPEKNWSR